MKITDLFEYKNKYYKPAPIRPKARCDKTLWYNDYSKWVGDIRMRYPDANVYFDEENEEILAGSEDCIQCYGRWAKNKKNNNGVTFFTARNMAIITKNAKRLKQIKKDNDKTDDQFKSTAGFSGLL